MDQPRGNNDHRSLLDEKIPPRAIDPAGPAHDQADRKLLMGVFAGRMNAGPATLNLEDWQVGVAVKLDAAIFRNRRASLSWKNNFWGLQDIFIG